MIEPPKEGEPVDQLWRYVVALTHRVNALSNMTVIISGRDPTTGKLEIHDNHSVLILY